jgi:hypothetical protein
MASGPVFIFCASELVFGGTEGVRSCFHVLRSHTHFVPYRGRRVPFTCFAFPDCFSAVPRASNSFFILFRFRTRFWRYRGCRVSFSCFALPDLVGSVQRASGPVFMFCAPGLAFDGTEGAWPCFHVLRSRNRLGPYQGRRVPF